MTMLHTRVRGERLYRLLLRLYPAEFRHRYGNDMLAFYRERVTADSSSPPRLALIWARVFPDLLISAVAERFGGQSRGRAMVASSPLPQPPEESMSILQQDVRFALRGMTQRPGFTAVVLTTLALGIGANAAIYSFMDSLLLRSLPVAAPDRLALLNWHAKIRDNHEFVMHGSHGSDWGMPRRAPAVACSHTGRSSYSGTTIQSSPASSVISTNRVWPEG